MLCSGTGTNERMETRGPQRGRIDSLDLLRGLAAFAVMVPHFFMYYLKETSTVAEIISVSAVEVFFVLSGFVLGPQIVLCAQRGNWSTLRTFLVRRWMRTIPPYLVALLAISIMFGAIGSVDFFRYAVYGQNLISQHNSRDYYPIAWSLSVEEWYYVTFPAFLLAYLGLTRKGNERLGYVFAAVLFIAAITVLRSLCGDVTDWGAHVRRVVVFRVDSIAYGFLLYLIVQRTTFAWTKQLRFAAFLMFVATSAAVLYVNNGMLKSDAAWLRQVNPFVSAAFGMAALVFFLSINALIRAGWLKSFCAYLGHISYPTYLFHLVILYALSHLLAEHELGISLLLYAASVVLFTTIFFFSFEKPILASRPRYRDIPGTESRARPDWEQPAETTIASS
jgi:peptidoglycan/LPS O-acetylase OafA/YrhL